LEDIGRLPGFKYPEFPDFARQYKSLKVQRYIGLDNEEQLVEQLNDRMEALTAIYRARVEATNVAQLSAYIDSLFSDETSPVTLSTCHRAKGLEGDRIFILKPEDMPMTWRNQLEWQKEQVVFLLYVALTRSKSELFVVGQPDWLPQEEDKTNDTTLASSPEKQLKFPLELKIEDEEEQDYSQEDLDEPTEVEIYAQMERVAQEDLLPEMAESFKNIDRHDIRELPPSAPRIPEPSPAIADAETVNCLQLGSTETPLKPALEAGSAPSRQWIDPRLITLDAGTQTRKETSQSKIDEYTLAMRDFLWDWNREPPAIFQDGENYYPGEGHHRIPAAIAAEVEQILVELRPGTLTRCSVLLLWRKQVSRSAPYQC
jgi:hypothetical protein